MTIPDEAVQAAIAHYSEGGCMGLDENERREVTVDMLTAAAPFLQGLKVKRIEWVNAKVSDKWERYTAFTIFGTYEALEWSDGTFGGSVPSQDGNEDNSEFKSDTLEAAKAAAQADYEARVLSAIEVSVLEPSLAEEPIGYLFQHEETGLTQVVEVQQVEWGFEKNNPRWQKISPVYTATVSEPSPRAQALEEAARLLEREAGELDGLVDSVAHHLHSKAKTIRALSSQPVADHIADAGKMVADGWLPIETAPKDGTEFLAWPCNTENGVIVVKAYWYVHPSIQAWITDEIDCGDFDFSPTHWRPLPASPEVSG